MTGAELRFRDKKNGESWQKASAVLFRMGFLERWWLKFNGDGHGKEGIPTLRLPGGLGIASGISELCIVQTSSD